VAWSRPLPGGKRSWRYLEHPRNRAEGTDALAADLRRALRPVQAAHVNAHVLLAAPQTHLRVVRLRVASRDALAEALRQRLPTLLPFDTARARTQFRILQEERGDTGIDETIQLASCELALLQEQLASLWRADWVPRHVCPPALALSRAAAALLPKDPAGEPLLMLHLGYRQTTMVLTKHAEVVFARDVALGTAHLVDALTHQVTAGAETIQLSETQAETLLAKAGFPFTGPGATQSVLPAATYAALLQPVLEQLASEVKRTVTFGVQSGDVAMPTRALLSGEGARLPQAEAWCRQQVSLPVERLSCQAVFGESGSHAAIVYGLALHEGPPKLDLQVPMFRQRRTVLRSARFACQGLATLVLVIWIGAGWLLGQHGTLRRQRAVLDAQWMQLSPVIALHEELIAHRQLVSRLVNTEGVPVGWLRKLASEFPDAVRLSRLAVAKERAEMEGDARARVQTPEAHVSALVLWLQRTGLCRDVQRTDAPRSGTGLSEARFALGCRLR